MLQPIPIPSQPFEVVAMDFIPELPECKGYDNVLVIVDKLTKYTIRHIHSHYYCYDTGKIYI